MSKKIGFTGTQVGITLQQALVLQESLAAERRAGADEFHHGDCIGADAQACGIARRLGYRTICHPPINTSKRAYTVNAEWREPAEYMVRNQQIVNESAVLFATPKESEEQLRSGTWSTVRKGIKGGRPVKIILPDGTVKNPQNLGN